MLITACKNSKNIKYFHIFRENRLEILPMCDILSRCQRNTLHASPSSRGLGHRVFIPATRVRIPLEMPFFLAFFCDTVSNPCKKQAATWKINFPVAAFSFCRNFLQAKNGITHFLAGCSALAQRGDARARRRSAPPSNPVGDAIFFGFLPKFKSNPCKKQPAAWKINFPVAAFSFCRNFLHHKNLSIRLTKYLSSSIFFPEIEIFTIFLQSDKKCGE